MRALHEAFQMAGLVLLVGIIAGLIGASAHACELNNSKVCYLERTVADHVEVRCR